MKVVILCGGKGTRLREETEYRPKPMVPIGGRPIVWHIMKTYLHYGHKDFILCLGYKGSMIKQYFRDYLWETSDVSLKMGAQTEILFHDQHICEDWTVTLADTGEESMTAYRVYLARKYLDDGETFLLTYGDGVSDIDLNALLRFHEKQGKICTLSGVHPAGRFGELGIHSGSIVSEFKEKPISDGSYINGGYMVCNPEIFNYITDDPNVMLEQAPMKRLVADRQLAVYRHEAFWQCMDTYAEYLYLDELWDKGQAPWKVW